MAGVERGQFSLEYNKAGERRNSDINPDGMADHGAHERSVVCAPSGQKLADTFLRGVGLPPMAIPPSIPDPQTRDQRVDQKYQAF